MNRSLKLFDIHCNLNRLNNKFKQQNNRIESMQIPSHCDLYIVDHMCDPDAWAKPISIPNVTILRTLGIHPKYETRPEVAEQICCEILLILAVEDFSFSQLMGKGDTC